MARFSTVYISFILSFLSINFASAQMESKMLCPMNYAYFGLANTNTIQGNGSLFNGFGPMAGIKFSGLAALSDDGNHRFYFTDMTSFDIGIGGRYMNKTAIASHALLDSNGAYFFFSFNIGFQTFYRITEKIDLGGQIFFNANYDDARAISHSGNDDNLMFGVHARYDRIVLELNEKLPNNTKDYQEFQNAKFAKLLYVYNTKNRSSIALSYDYFTVDHSNNENMNSSNIRLLWLLGF